MSNERTARQAIKVWLAERDHTQRWLAKRLKISESVVSNILSGHAAPSDEVADRLSKLTGIDVRDFARVA